PARGLTGAALRAGHPLDRGRARAAQPLPLPRPPHRVRGRAAPYRAVDRAQRPPPGRVGRQGRGRAASAGRARGPARFPAGAPPSTTVRGGWRGAGGAVGPPAEAGRRLAPPRKEPLMRKLATVLLALGL